MRCLCRRVDALAMAALSPLTMFHFLPPQERRGATAALEAAQPLPDQSQQRSEVTAVGSALLAQESGRVKDKLLLAKSHVSLLVKTTGTSSARRADNEEFGEWHSGAPQSSWF